jgi:hypothetical protein
LKIVAAFCFFVGYESWKNPDLSQLPGREDDKLIWDKHPPKDFFFSVAYGGGQLTTANAATKRSGHCVGTPADFFTDVRRPFTAFYLVFISERREGSHVSRFALANVAGRAPLNVNRGAQQLTTLSEQRIIAELAPRTCGDEERSVNEVTSGVI